MTRDCHQRLWEAPQGNVNLGETPHSREARQLTTITADDIRVLAQSTDEDPALALVDGDVQVVPNAEVADGHLVYTKADLIAAYGEEITDVQAEVLAAGLTAQLVP
jgi:hypothetical protein